MKFLVLVSVLLVTGLEGAKRGPCFNFNGNDFINYNYDYVDISSSAWYRLSFKTVESEGLILYAQGSHDYEALFVRDGFLYYFLFNPTQYGDGGTFGGEFRSERRVNNDTWITVDVFRNRIPKKEQKEPTTGMMLTVEGGSKEKHIESGERVNIQIVKPIYIGGIRDGQVNGAVKFKGQIRDMKDKNSGTIFNDPSYSTGNVDRCLDQRIAA